MSSLRCVSSDCSTFASSSAATRASSLLNVSLCLPMFLRAATISGWRSEPPALRDWNTPADIRPVCGRVSGEASTSGWVSVACWRVEICPLNDGDRGAADLSASSTGREEEGELVREAAVFTVMLLEGVCVGLTAISPECAQSWKTAETCWRSYKVDSDLWLCDYKLIIKTEEELNLNASQLFHINIKRDLIDFIINTNFRDTYLTWLNAPVHCTEISI